MDPIKKIGAASAARLTALNTLRRRHRFIASLTLTILSLALVVGTSQQGLIQAGPVEEPAPPQSILPQSIGVGIATNEPITIEFDAPMDRASVAAGLQVLPGTSFWLAWTRGDEVLRIYPTRRWATDERYVVAIAAATEQRDGTPLGSVRRLTFTTQTAPVVTGFALQNPGLLPAEVDAQLTSALDPSAAEADAVIPEPGELGEVSARSKVTIRFNTRMSRDTVEEAFAITPHAEGKLAWEDDALTFTPIEGGLEPNARYTISLAGSRDVTGNRISGETSFSFTTVPGAQLVKVRPKAGELSVTDGPIELWFSQPMNTEAVEAAFSLLDTASGDELSGTFSWNWDLTQLRFEPAEPMTSGTVFEVHLGDGAADLDGNPIEDSYRFVTGHAPASPSMPGSSAPGTATTEASQPAAAATPAAPAAPQPTPAPSAPTPAPAPAAPAPPPSGDLAAYALHQVNSARAAYGFAPLVLDSRISAVASAHAWDQLRYGYFSHTGRDGSSVHQRLSRAGIAFSAASENQCQQSGRPARAVLDWCHSYFMAEPYPGHWNHIGNILNPRFTRMGVGIAESGGRVIITWDFAG